MDDAGLVTVYPVAFGILEESATPLSVKVRILPVIMLPDGMNKLVPFFPPILTSLPPSPPRVIGPAFVITCGALTFPLFPTTNDLPSFILIVFPVTVTGFPVKSTRIGIPPVAPTFIGSLETIKVSPFPGGTDCPGAVTGLTSKVGRVDSELIVNGTLVTVKLSAPGIPCVTVEMSSLFEGFPLASPPVPPKNELSLSKTG